MIVTVAGFLPNFGVIHMTTPTAIPAYQASRNQILDTVKPGLFQMAIIALSIVMICLLRWTFASAFKGPEDIWIRLIPVFTLFILFYRCLVKVTNLLGPKG